MRNLFIDKVNNSFRSMTNTRQASGLSVCLSMIANSVDGSIKIDVSSPGQIDIAIDRFRPKNLIIGYSFMTASDLTRLRSRYPHLKIYVMFHSPSSFLAADNIALKRLYETTESGCTVILNDPRFNLGLDRVIHLENCYSINFQDYKAPEDDGNLHVICSGSIRVFKNHLSQAMAAIRYADSKNLTLNFYCNLARGELSGAVAHNLSVLFTRNKKHKLVSLPWQNHQEFIKSLSKYHLGMQVSMTESYNIVSADYINAGLPMIVSDEIRFASDSIKCNINNIDEMVSKMETAHLHVEESRDKLLAHNNKAVESWRKELNSRA